MKGQLEQTANVPADENCSVIFLRNREKRKKSAQIKVLIFQYVVDAYRIMKTNGPRGRSASDVVLAKGLFISPDIVAVDTAASKFFNQVREIPILSERTAGTNCKCASR